MSTVKHAIRNRWTNEVLFECEVPDGMASGLRTRHVLEQAVKARANLASANLAGAKWRDGVIINKAPVQVSGLLWFVTILDAHMQIGCELHSLADWASFDDRRIVEMGGRDALRFWRENKETLLSLARAAGRSFEAQTA